MVKGVFVQLVGGATNTKLVTAIKNYFNIMHVIQAR